MDVKDSQIVNVHVEWKPVSRFVDYENPQEKLIKQNAKLKAKLKELKNENELLKNDSNNASDNKRNKISSLFKK